MEGAKLYFNSSYSMHGKRYCHTCFLVFFFFKSFRRETSTLSLFFFFFFLIRGGFFVRFLNDNFSYIYNSHVYCLPLNEIFPMRFRLFFVKILLEVCRQLWRKHFAVVVTESKAGSALTWFSVIWISYYVSQPHLVGWRFLLHVLQSHLHLGFLLYGGLCDPPSLPYFFSKQRVEDETGDGGIYSLTYPL